MIRPGGIVCAAVAALVVWTVPAAAHRVFVSRYTFNRDVLPIVRSRCTPCHDEGGVAEMPLVRYEEARRSAWPIRQSLVSGRMPPWFGDSTTPFQNERRLTASELDVLMTWATGSEPEGAPPAPPPPAPPTASSWSGGPPDVNLAMPQPFSLGRLQQEAVYETALPAEQIRGRMIRAIDLRPGTPAVVRSAAVALRTGDGEQTLALWQPGDAMASLTRDAGFFVPNDASIVLRIRYRRPSDRRDAVSDRSDVGFYFAGPHARPVRTITLGIDGAWPMDREQTVLQPLGESLRIVALRPISGPVDASVQLTVVGHDGTRTPLARLELRDGWARRYVFVMPVRIAAGQAIEARVRSAQGLLWTRLTGDRAIGPAAGGPFRFALEVVD